MNYTFDDKMIRLALKANGYHTLWNEDNWVHDSDSNPDWSGRPMEIAFEELLYKLNLISKKY